ncbi:MAG: very short patch repair endonuclease [Patescibacteria group bacterium]|nr:DNA mismatch endonuclease Vsr [Patescibacteria group bacterium]MDE1945607.1 very short patch repair endonuclease [Patescibacteria group bacterium]
MTDFLSKKKRSELMAKIKSRNTKLEIDFNKLLSSKVYPLGFRYRKHYKLFGKPDIAFVKQKIAVFVDSEFWHGYQFEKNKEALKTKFWLNKIKGNIARDKEVNKILKKKGWKVLRFWEKKIQKKFDQIISEILVCLKTRSS